MEEEGFGIEAVRNAEKRYIKNVIHEFDGSHGLYQVAGGEREHLVYVNGEGEVFCDCWGFVRSKGKCSHVLVVKRHIRELRRNG